MILNLPLPPSQNQLLRMHWSKRKRIQRDLAWEIVSQAGQKKNPPQRARVAITRKTCGKAPDTDNLYAANKLVLDAMQQANVIRDDSPDAIILTTKWERAAKRVEQGVIVEVTRA